MWPGNDAVKVKFVNTLRQTQAKSVFAEDLKAIARTKRDREAGAKALTRLGSFRA